MKPTPAAVVVGWVAARPAASLFTTSITQAEVLHGIMLLPKGRRRTGLEEAALGMFEQDFAGRVLPFGGDAAKLYAIIAADRRRMTAHFAVRCSGCRDHSLDASSSGNAECIGLRKMRDNSDRSLVAIVTCASVPCGSSGPGLRTAPQSEGPCVSAVEPASGTASPGSSGPAPARIGLMSLRQKS